MKKISIICSIIFVFGMTGSSVLAQCDDGDACTVDQYDAISGECTLSLSPAMMKTPQRPIPVIRQMVNACILP